MPIIKRRLERRNRHAGLVAKVLAVRVARSAAVIPGAVVMRRATGVVIVSRRQARIGQAGTDTEQPQDQHSGCPAAEVAAVAEHGRSMGLCCSSVWVKTLGAPLTKVKRTDVT
jgi:hypothetical protein